jgi:NADH:ubiquinone oxidoreductase subunit H
MDKKSPLAALLASRKTILLLFAVVLVLVMCTGLETAIVVAASRGRITIEAAIALSFGPLATGAIGVVVMAAKVIQAISVEDAAEKGATAPIAAGGNVVIEAKKDEGTS